METNKLMMVFSMWLIHIAASAQIGYQVSLLNSATGEPRVAETVEVKITLTNSEGTTIHEETQTETTNDFGILSLAVGNSSTFEEVDWSKLPFFISVSVDGKLVGKSQVLTVPVAEYAKKTGTLTKEILCSKEWEGTLFETEDWYNKYQCRFSDKGFVLERIDYGDGEEIAHKEWKGSYVIDANDIICTFVEYGATHGFILKFTNNAIYSFDGFKSFILK